MALSLFWIVGCSWVGPEVSWTAVWQILGFLCQKQGSQLSRALPQQCLFFKKDFNSFVCLWLCWVSVALWAFAPAAVPGLLIAVASLVAEHGLWSL